MQQGEVQATPEEEAQLKQAFDVALDVIHAPGKAGDNIVQMVLDSQQIQKGLGQAVATVLVTVEKQMTVADDILLVLAQEVTAELAELAIEAGALSEDELNEQMLDAIISHATSQYIELKEAMGELDQGQLQSSVQEAQAFMGQQQKPAAAPAQSGGLLQRARG